MTRLRRRRATRVVALLVAVLTLLGVQLFLPATAVACGPAMSDCCCTGEVSDPAVPARAESCDCTVSQPTPVPAADVAPSAVFVPPLIPTETADDLRAANPPTASRPPAPPSRSRAAPTQALLETFRN